MGWSWFYFLTACAKQQLKLLTNCPLFPITFPSLFWNHCQHPNVQISHFVGKVQIFRFAWQQQPCLCCSLCGVSYVRCGSVARRWDPPIGWRWRWHSTSAVARQQSSMEQVREDSSGGGGGDDGQKSSYRDHCGYLGVETTRHCAPPSYTTSLCTAAVSGADIGDLIVVQILSITLVLFSE